MPFYFHETTKECLGCWDGSAPEHGIEVPSAPIDGRQVWNGAAWVWPLALIQELRCDEVDAFRDNLFETTNVPFGLYAVQMRKDDQDRITAKGAYAKFSLITSGGASWPGNSKWIMAGNEEIVVTAQQMSDLADAVAARVEAIMFIAKGHKNVIRGYSNPQDVLAHDITTGWN